MSTSVERYPLTSAQQTVLREDLILIEEKLQDICVLMHACHGDDSPPAIRADEAAAAWQRLKWELERIRQNEHAAEAG